MYDNTKAIRLLNMVYRVPVFLLLLSFLFIYILQYNNTANLQCCIRFDCFCYKTLHSRSFVQTNNKNVYTYNNSTTALNIIFFASFFLFSLRYFVFWLCTTIDYFCCIGSLLYYYYYIFFVWFNFSI